MSLLNSKCIRNKLVTQFRENEKKYQPQMIHSYLMIEHTPFLDLPHRWRARASEGRQKQCIVIAGEIWEVVEVLSEVEQPKVLGKDWAGCAKDFDPEAINNFERNYPER